MPISDCTQAPLPSAPGSGAAVSTCPADGLPQSPRVVERTCPPSVVTEPPCAFWNGSGMSTSDREGHSTTAPMATATPIRASTATTMRAASGLSGAGPLAECWWEWATGYWR